MVQNRHAVPCHQFIFALFCCGYVIIWIYMANSPIFFGGVFFALRQTCDCPSVSEVIVRDMENCSVPFSVCKLNKKNAWSLQHQWGVTTYPCNVLRLTILVVLDTGKRFWSTRILITVSGELKSGLAVTHRCPFLHSKSVNIWSSLPIPFQYTCLHV